MLLFKQRLKQIYFFFEEVMLDLISEQVDATRSSCPWQAGGK